MRKTLPRATVALIHELYGSGNYSHASLADELNRRGIKTASEKGKWRKNTVQIVLKLPNPAKLRKNGA